MAALPVSLVCVSPPAGIPHSPLLLVPGLPAAHGNVSEKTIFTTYTEPRENHGPLSPEPRAPNRSRFPSRVSSLVTGSCWAAPRALGLQLGCLWGQTRGCGRGSAACGSDTLSHPHCVLARVGRGRVDLGEGSGPPGSVNHARRTHVRTAAGLAHRRPGAWVPSMRVRAPRASSPGRCFAQGPRVSPGLCCSWGSQGPCFLPRVSAVVSQVAAGRALRRPVEEILTCGQVHGPRSPFPLRCLPTRPPQELCARF